MKKIVVVGSSNLDMIVRAYKLPRPGETIIGGEFLTAHGGKGANQAVAAARAGGDVAFVSAVGGDTFEEELIAGYILDAINTQFVFKESDAATGVAMIAVAADGENSIIVAPGANALLSPSHLPEIAGVIDNAALVVLQLEIPIETVEAVADYASVRSIPVILNPAPALSLSDSLFPHVTYITPNETEAKMLTGISVKDEASAAVHSKKRRNYCHAPTLRKDRYEEKRSVESQTRLHDRLVPTWRYYHDLHRGYPIPFGKENLDLSATVNLPRSIGVAKVILDDLNIEGVIVASEMEQRSKWFYDALTAILPDVPLKKISHAEFKEMGKKEENIMFVRTGEVTPFAKIMLVSDVIF